MSTHDANIIWPQIDSSGSDAESIGDRRGFKVVWDRHCRGRLKEPLIDFVKHHCLDGDNLKANPPLPVFIVFSKTERNQYGLSIPVEFVLEVDELDRVHEHLAMLNANYEHADVIKLYRIMLTGCFRKFFFLDDDNHGHGEMDIANLAGKDTPNEWTYHDGDKDKTWVERLESKLVASLQTPEFAVYKALFADEIARLNTFVKAASSLTPSKGTKDGG